MTSSMSSSSSSSSFDLAKEAMTTRDCERQQQLASHPSAIVRWHLVRNHALCDAALGIIGGDEVQRLRTLAEDQLHDALGEIDS